MKKLYIKNYTLATRLNRAKNVSVGFDYVQNPCRFIFYSEFSTSFSFYRKLNIRDYVRINYLNKELPLPKTNFLFLEKYCIRRNREFGHICLDIDKILFNYWLEIYLNIYKNNKIINKNKYSYFLLSTPTNIICRTVVKEIEFYYSRYYQKYSDYRGIIYYLGFGDKYKYGLISLWHKLGKELYLDYFQYMYELYTLHYIEIGINGSEYRKFNVSLELKDIELDYYISFVEFKNLLIRETYEFEVEDYIRYGKDMYIFILFYVYIFKSNSFIFTNGIKGFNSNNKYLNEILKPNHLPSPPLFYVNSSRNYINKCIVNINWEKEKVNLNPCGIYYMPNNNINYNWFYYNSRAINRIKNPMTYHERLSFIKCSKRSYSQQSTYSIINKHNTKKTFKYNSPIFNMLSNYISNNPINESSQREIEKFLLDYSYINLDNKQVTNHKIDYSLVNSELTKILLNERSNIYKLIDSFKSEFKNNKNVKTDQLDLKAKLELYKILLNLDNEYIVNIMFGRLLRIISSYKKTKDESITGVSIGHDLGIDIINKYYYNLYSKSKKKISSFSNWKKENKWLLDEYDNTTLIFSIGSILIEWMVTLKLLTIKTVVLSKKEKSNILVPCKRIVDIVGENFVYNLPKKIPMIVKPKLHTREYIEGKWVNNLGGYLLNDEIFIDEIIKRKWDNKEPTEILEDNIIYDLVNNLSFIGYKINIDVLDFILDEGYEYFNDVIIDEKYIHPFLEKRKLTKKQSEELDSFLSKKDLQENIIGLATVFSKVPEFYIPVNLDYRGRLYCMVDYLHYQSNELAKSLLLFSKSDKMYKTDELSINYLKIYGANCFGLNKKSLVDRINWIDSNINDIIDFKNGKLIKQAESKFLFTAFCIEYNRWLQCLDNNEITYFETYLPIQMDATCNGFQHLSLLSSDQLLASELNLTQSSWSDKPKDFYSFLVNCLIDYFRKKLDNNIDSENKIGYQRLINFEIQRKIIKKSIMTIPYNVSTYQLIKYIKENFVQVEQSDWYYLMDDKKVKLKFSDFNLLGKGLRIVLSEQFPKLGLLLDYLKNVAELCYILGIPIPWNLPSGIRVRQSYLEQDKVVIKPFSYENSSFTLNVRNKKKYDKEKQKRSFMPNLVHSLDSSSLAMLVDLYFKVNGGIKNIFTVHDCFAVTANNVSNLMNLLKVVYINIYSDETYLLKLDKEIKHSIKVHYGENAIDENLVIKITANEKLDLSFPDINKVLGKILDFNSLKQSSYILN